jgi:5-methylcytosine-specific restriction endonuclease McrA
MARLNHKRGRKSNYVKSLDNDYHKEVRRRVFIRDGFKCRRCGKKIFLESHHIAYYVDGVSIVGHELEEDNLKWVVTACSECHPAIHKNVNDRWNPKNRFKEHV